jgi:hypothetical protein
MVKALDTTNLEQAEIREGLFICNFLDQVEEAIMASTNASKDIGDERRVIDNMERDVKAGCQARDDVRQTSS